jgi:hypothetical protein
MKGPLEKNIEQQLAGFEIEPSPHIWTEVEKNLHPHRKDRGVFWWWVLLLGVTVVAVFFWKPDQLKLTQKKDIILQKTLPKVNTVQLMPFAAPINDLKPAQLKNAGMQSILTTKTHPIIDPYPKEPEVLKADNDQINLPIKDREPLVNQSEIPEKSEDVSDKVPATFSNQKENNPVKNQDSPVTKKDTVLKKQPIPLKITSLNKGKWFFTAEGGTINLKGTNLFHSIVNYPAYTGANATTGGAQQIFTTSPQTGFQLTAGIRYHKILSKQFAAETGLQYHYIQNKQYTGNKDITGMYYLPGNSLLLTNHAHILEVPVFIKMYLNPDKANPIYLLTGISAEWLFQKKWLITDYTLNNYYYDPSSIKNLQLKLSGGVGIQFKNDINAVIKFSQGISPVYQKNNLNQFKQEYSAGLLIPLQHPIHKAITK